MNILIAFDKFKDALTAREVCETATLALSEIHPEWTINQAPLADGGDGFCDTLTGLAQGEFVNVRVDGPIGESVEARFGIVTASEIRPRAMALLDLPDSVRNVGILELAQSSGIALVPPEDRSPWTTSSFGLGQMMRQAKENGVDALLIGLGGSATHDLALGALQAIGYHFIEKNASVVGTYPSPNTWQEIAAVERSDWKGLPLRIACDVDNPLVGPNGAAAVFGPQKGLQAEDFDLLDSLTKRMAILLCHTCDKGTQTMDTPGVGAAGGAAFGLMTALNGELVSGAKLVFEWIGIEDKLANADLVITGEGRFDASSLQGKGPGALARQALAAGKQAHVFAGSIGELEESIIPEDNLHAISPLGMPIADALASTRENLVRALRNEFSNK